MAIRLPYGAAAVLWLGLCGAWAQEARGPVMGMVVDLPSRTAHPVLGVAGAATIGAAVGAGADVLAQAVSPRGDYVLVLSGETHEAALWLTGGGLRILTGVKPAPDRVELSPEGTAAAFYYRGEDRMQVISGLPDAPAAVREIPLSTLRGRLGVFAVSDDGAAVLCAESSGYPAPAVAVIGPGGELNRIALPGPAAAVAFAGRSRAAVLASGGHAIFVPDAGRQAAGRSLASEGLEGIAAAAVADGGQQVILAGTSGRISIVSSETGEALAAADCRCAPDQVSRMNHHGAYRLTSFAGQSVSVLDGASRPPRILVIPPAPDPGPQQ